MSRVVESPEKRYIATSHALFLRQFFVVMTSRIKFSLRWLFCILALVFSCSGVLAQLPLTPLSWQQAGTIPGQNIICLHATGGEFQGNPSTVRLLAGTNDGVFRSINSGATWIQTQGWNKQQVTSFFVANDGTLFATTWGNGIYRSTNDGASWTASNQGLPPINYETRTMAQCGSRLFVGTSRGLCYSDDNGRTWDIVIGVSRDVRSVLVLGQTVFAGTLNDGILRSPDGGVTWEFANNGLPANARYIVSFAVGFQSFGDNLAIFAATNLGGVVRSLDNGNTWSLLSSSFVGQTLQCLAINGDADNEMYAGTRSNGVYRSKNNNPAMWSPENQGLGNQNIFSLALSGSVLFAGAEDGGVWTSTIPAYAGFARVVKNVDLGETISGVAGKPQGFPVFGQGIRGNVIVKAPLGVEIATSINGEYKSSLTLTANMSLSNNGRIDQTVFARLNSASALTLNDTITVDAGVVFKMNVKGKVVDPAPLQPVLAISPATLTLGGVIQGESTTAQTLTLTGANLATPVVLTAPVGTLLFDTARRVWTQILSLTPTSGSLNIGVSIRLDSSLTPRTILGVVSGAVQSGMIQTSATVSGSIIAKPLPPAPQLTAQPLELGFGTIILGNASPVRTYTLTGTNLTAPVEVFAPPGVLLRHPASGLWVSAMTLATTSTGSLMQSLAVRLDSSALRVLSGGLAASIRHITTNTSATVTVQGIVQDAPTLEVLPSAPLAFGTVRLGSTPAPQRYTLIGRNLLETVVITAPQGIEILDTATNTWGRSLRLMLTFTPNNANIRCNFTVRFDASTVRNIDSVIVNTSGLAEASVKVTGVVIPQPELLTTALQPENLDTIVRFDPSRVGSYSLTGRFLAAPVAVTAPEGVLVFDKTRNVWTQTLTFTPDAQGSVTETVAVRLDSSRLGSVRDSVRNVSGSTFASVSVRGAVVALALPPGAETTLELRLVGPQPLRVRDTARVQVWLKDSRLLTPRLIGRFLRTLRVTVRIDTNNLAVLGSSPLTPRARIESPTRVPADTPLYTILAERTDTTSMSNVLLAEMLLQATVGVTTSNTLRITAPTAWFGSDGTSASATDVRIVWATESVPVQLRPLFVRRNGLVLAAPNPSQDEVRLLYTLAEDTGAAVLTVSDASGRVVKRVELGARTAGLAQQETVRLGDLAMGSYLVSVVTARETLTCSLEVVR